MEISKKAGLLQKPVHFTDRQGQIDVSIPSNEKLLMEYIDKNPVDRQIQVQADFSAHEVNTYR